MTPVEIIAVIVAILGLMKMIFFLYSPKYMNKMIDGYFGWPMHKNPFMYLGLILAAVVIYFLWKETSVYVVLTSMVATGLLMHHLFMSVPQKTKALTKELMKHKGRLVVLVLFMLFLCFAVLFKAFA